MSERSQIIADAITNAILSQALSPGAKLGERELSEACDVSRAVVKQSLLILAQSGLVTTRVNKGACVAQLTIQDAYDLFDAFTTLEQGVAVQLVNRLSSGEWDILDQQVQQVTDHIDSGDVEKADKFGPEFHSLLVGFLRNKSVKEMHDRLIRKSSLLRALYVNKQYHRCRLNEEHGELIALLRTRQLDKALKLIDEHYRSIARGFDMDAVIPETPDLKMALAPWLALEA